VDNLGTSVPIEAIPVTARRGGDWGALQTAVVKQTLVGLPVHASDRLRPVKPVGSG
jgi:hypothetical protein